MAVILRCPACREKFKYDVTDGWPDECPLCKTDINNRRADDDVVIPAFLSQKSKNNDKVVRDMMDGSETRANMAAAMAGVPASEMAGLKITDLNDRRDAEISAKPVHNEVTQHMAAMQSRGMPVGFGVQNPQGYASVAHTGVEPYAGARTRTRLQRALPPIGQAPLPLQITDNPYYRRPA
jgi:hypothetical protein